MDQDHERLIIDHKPEGLNQLDDMRQYKQQDLQHLDQLQEQRFSKYILIGQ